MFSRIARHALKQCSQISRRTLCDESARPAATVQKPALSGERGVNKVTLIGRCGRTPEVRGSEESPVTLFPLATSQSYKQPDGTYKQYTDWHRVIIFKQVLGNVISNLLEKGDRVYVSGAIQYQKYQDQESGRDVHVTQIRADDVIVLQKSRANQSQEQNKVSGTTEEEMMH